MAPPKIKEILKFILWRFKMSIKKDALYESIEDTIQRAIDEGWVQEVYEFEDPRMEAMHKKLNWFEDAVSASVNKQAMDLFDQKLMAYSTNEDDWHIDLLEQSWTETVEDLFLDDVIEPWVLDSFNEVA